MDVFFIFGAKYLFVLSPFILVYFFFKISSEKRKQILIFTCVSLPLTYLAGLLARELYFNPRPFVVGGFEPLIPHTPDNGFPSDHILLLSALASLVLVYDKKFSITFWSIVLLVGLSRMYVGVHYFIDVLGSVLIALIFTLVAYAIIHKLWNKNNQASF